MSDKIKITILEDGTIKTETDRVSAPNHSNAEQFLLHIAQLTGGITRRIMRAGASLHAALHEHTKDGHHH